MSVITVNSNKEDFISGSINGKAYNIGYTEETFNQLLQISEELEALSNKAKSMDEFTAGAQPLFDTAESLITVDYKETVAASNPYLVYNPQTGEYYLKIEDLHSKHPIPEKFVEIIENAHENKQQHVIVAVVNLCKRFLDNPYFTKNKFEMLANEITTTFVDKKEVARLMEEEGLSEEIAIKRATYPDKEITKEGYLRTFKVVEQIKTKWVIEKDDQGKPKLDTEGKPIKKQVPRFGTDYDIDENTGEVTEKEEIPFLEDRLFKPAIYQNGKDFYSGDKLGYHYKIGELHRLPSWDDVDVRDNVKHSGSGLYTGGRAYVECYVNDSRELVDAFVCPSKIAKFTDNGTGELVCLEMFIHGATQIEGNTRNLYNASTYGKIQKEQFDAELKDSIERTNELRDEQDSDLKLRRKSLASLDLLSE